MSTFLLIFALGATVYLCRASGFVIAVPASMPWLHEALRFVPIAIFAALVVPSLAREPEIAPAKIAALVIAALFYLRFRRLDLALFIGLITLWIVIYLFSA